MSGPRVKETVRRSPLGEDFLSKDASRILHATWEVFRTRDPEVLRPLVPALALIEEATEDVELGGALASNAANLGHALERIRIFGKGDCLCAAYQGHQFYDVEKEQRQGHVRVVEEIPTPRAPDRICECCDCGKRFRVEEGESHYPWWQWTELVP